MHFGRYMSDFIPVSPPFYECVQRLTMRNLRSYPHVLKFGQSQGRWLTGQYVTRWWASIFINPPYFHRIKTNMPNKCGDIWGASCSAFHVHKFVYWNWSLPIHLTKCSAHRAHTEYVSRWICVSCWSACVTHRVQVHFIRDVVPILGSTSTGWASKRCARRSDNHQFGWTRVDGHAIDGPTHQMEQWWLFSELVFLVSLCKYTRWSWLDCRI